MSLLFEFSERERTELKERPIDLYRKTDFTDEQFQVRLALAKRLQESLLTADTTASEELIQIYDKVPMWAFYTTLPNGKGAPRRVFGVGKNTEGEEYAQTVTGLNMLNNRTVGGVPADELAALRVDRLKYDDVSRTRTPGLFIDPLGFLPILEEEEEQ